MADDKPDKLSQLMGLGSYFLSGILAINATQVLGAPLALINQDWYNAWIAFTKQSFNLLTITLTQWFNPTTVRVSGDASMRGQLFKRVDGNLLCNFPERMVLIANHQIYTDWLYLWWIAFCSGMHGRLYIILKESLRRIPVIGWGIQLSQFIFLKRNWEKDKPNLAKHLQGLNKITDPMWLLLFPEGTNLAPSTRASSKKWADKNGIDDMQHTLHPRTTGLLFCLQELRRTVGYVYDCTIAYEGVPRGQYAQDIYTLQAQYIQGRSPKCVHMYWRRFRISDIPIDNEKSFESWLRARWIEKDAYIEYFYRTGNFPNDVGTTKMRDGSLRKGAGYITTTIRATQWHEFLQVFVPIGVLSLVLYTFYGELPQAFMKAIGQKAVAEQTQAVKSQFGPSPKTITTYPGGPTITINSDKLDPKEAAQLLQKTTTQHSSQAPARKATSTASSNTPSLTPQKLAQVPQTSPAGFAGLRSSASSTAWETMTNASIKSIPKLAPKALHKPLPNPATTAQKPSTAAKPVVKRSAANVAKSKVAMPATARQIQPLKAVPQGTNRPTKAQAKAPVKAPAKIPSKPATKPVANTTAKPAIRAPAKLAADKPSLKSLPRATPPKIAAGTKK